MAKLFLDAGDTFTLSNDATVIGSTGTETVKISGTPNVQLDANIERIELSGNAADYTYQISGTTITVYSAGVAVATLNGLNQDATVAFADGAATLALTGIGAATLGGTALPTTAAAVTPATVDATDVSTVTTVTAPVAGAAFALTNSTTADVLTLNSNANDTVTGAAGTVAATDVVVDADGSDADIANLTVTSYDAAIKPTITNVESVNVIGAYTTTGLNVLNLTGTDTLTLSAGISGTGTVADISTTKVGKVVAGTNVGTLNVTSVSTGTAGTVEVDTGAATLINVNGGAGTDAFTLLIDGDTATLNGGAASNIETLTLSTSGSASTLTLGEALNNTATTGATVVTGSANLTIVADPDSLTGKKVSKSDYTGTLTVELNAAATAAALNKVEADILKISTNPALANVAVNNNTTVLLKTDTGTTTSYAVSDNTGVAKDTLKFDVAANQTTFRSGTNLDIIDMTVSKTSALTITTLDTTTAGGANAETLSLTSAQDVTISTVTMTANSVISAANMTGKLNVGATATTDAITVVGGSGNDTFVGSTVADVLNGGAGNDTIRGNVDNDTMSGGSGVDSFTLAAADITGTKDVITDFTAGASGDVLDVDSVAIPTSLKTATMTTETIITNDSIYTVNYGGAIGTAAFDGADFGLLFGAGKAFGTTVAVADSLLVVVQGTDKTQVLVIDGDVTANAATTLAAGDIDAVITLSGTTSADAFVIGNFA